MFWKFFSFLLLFGIYLSTYQTVSADLKTVKGSGGFSNINFVINTYNPNDATEESQKLKLGENIQISITPYQNDAVVENFFQSDKKYFLLLTNPTGQTCERQVVVSGNPVPSTIGSTLELKIGSNNDLWSDINLKSSGSSGFLCKEVDGTWGVKVWMTSSSPANTLIDEKSAYFIDTPQEGGKVSLEYHNAINYVCDNKTTEVEIRNTQGGKQYTVWWKGQVTNTATKNNQAYTSSGDNQTVLVELTGNGIDPSTTTQEACAGEGNRYPIQIKDNVCKPFTIIKNPTDPRCQQTTELKCLAKMGSLNNILFSASNLPPNTDQTVILKDTNGTVLDQKTVKTNASGSIAITFGDAQKPLTAGKYNTSIDGICSTDTDVSQKSVGGPKICQGAECAQGAGLSCQGGQGVLTAIGCIPTDPSKLVQGLLTFATTAAGGIALLLMGFGALQMITSAGNPDNLKKGQQQFTSAIMGLLFIIFSVLLLQIIGVDLLGLPGFG